MNHPWVDEAVNNSSMVCEVLQQLCQETSAQQPPSQPKPMPQPQPPPPPELDAPLPPRDWGIRQRRSRRMVVNRPARRSKAVAVTSSGNVDVSGQRNLNLSRSKAMSSEPMRQAPNKKPRTKNLARPKEEVSVTLNEKKRRQLEQEIPKADNLRIKIKHPCLKGEREGSKAVSTSEEAQGLKVNTSTKTYGLEVGEVIDNQKSVAVVVKALVEEHMAQNESQKSEKKGEHEGSKVVSSTSGEAQGVEVNEPTKTQGLDVGEAGDNQASVTTTSVKALVEEHTAQNESLKLEKGKREGLKVVSTSREAQGVEVNAFTRPQGVDVREVRDSQVSVAAAGVNAPLEQQIAPNDSQKLEKMESHIQGEGNGQEAVTSGETHALEVAYGESHGVKVVSSGDTEEIVTALEEGHEAKKKLDDKDTEEDRFVLPDLNIPYVDDTIL